MHITRKKTRQIQAGSVKIGGDAPISVQSMCSTNTRDVKATVSWKRPGVKSFVSPSLMRRRQLRFLRSKPR